MANTVGIEHSSKQPVQSWHNSSLVPLQITQRKSSTPG